MATITLEPLRWLEEPSRITISQNGDGLRSFYQVTAPRDLAAMCKGRPVEELPRILSILSPAHHLASASALDNLFGVTPPPLAQAMREALAQSHIFKHHLKKLFFLVSSQTGPIVEHLTPKRRAKQEFVPQHVLEEMMHGVAMAQEAATILGGRSDHPLTAIAGGVSRFLKKQHHERLAEIAEFCLSYVLRLRGLIHSKVVEPGNVFEDLMSLSVSPMASIALGEDKGAIVVTGPSGSESQRLSADKALDALETQTEPWTYLPFARLKGKPWKGPMSDDISGLYFVGPLARLNRNKAAETGHAEEERQSLFSSLGSFPQFSVAAAYRALMVELVQAAEKMKDLFTEEKLTGPEIRTIPSRLGRVGHAAFEAPEGFIYHQYVVDERGVVEDVTILDAAAENNGLRCLLTRKIVEDSVARGMSWDKTKSSIELGLMPF